MTTNFSYEKKIQQLVNNSININKMNNYLSPQITEHKKDCSI